MNNGVELKAFRVVRNKGILIMLGYMKEHDVGVTELAGVVGVSFMTLKKFMDGSRTLSPISMNRIEKWIEKQEVLEKG